MTATPAQLEAIAPDWLEFIRADDWGVIWKRPRVAERLQDPETYIHHGAGGRFGLDPRQAMRDLQRWFHDVKNYSTIGYDVMVHRNVVADTVAICGAREAWLSAATRDRNDLGEAICLMGYFHPGHSLSEHPTERELEALAFAVAWSIAHGWSAPDTNVLGHRDNPAHPGATGCPGDYLYPHVPSIGVRALELLAAAAAAAGGRPPLTWRQPMATLHMLDEATRLADTRLDGNRRPVRVGDRLEVNIPAPPDLTEPVRAAVLTVTLTQPTGGGVHLMPGSSLTSLNNDAPGHAPSPNTTLVNVRDGVVELRVGGQVGATVHIVVDLIAVIA